jgi:RecB family exonuclease
LTTGALLAEERRLFYVACTRARQRLLVTAVASPDDEGEQPSRFLDELGVPVASVKGRPARPLSLSGLVAELRRTVADPLTGPALRSAAAARLACLALVEHHGRPLVPQADPGTWWGTRGRTLADRPVRSAEAPVSMSASALEALLTCPARWFLEREAGGETATSASQGFGLVVHALADRIVKGDLAGDPGSVPELMAHIDKVWGQIPFRTPWSAAKERAEVEQALTRFVQWHGRPGARTVLATEQQLRAEVTLPDGQQVSLTGYADRLEVDDDGRVVVIDLKTTKYPPTDKELAANPQLGLYQHAVAHGAVDDLLGRRAEPGGAELVQLRKSVRGAAKVQTQDPQEPGEDGHTSIERQLMQAVRAVRSEEFEARAGDHCTRCAFQVTCPVRGAGTVLS